MTTEYIAEMIRQRDEYKRERDAAVEMVAKVEAEKAEEYRKRCVWVRRAEDRGERLDAILAADSVDDVFRAIAAARKGHS